MSNNGVTLKCWLGVVQGHIKNGNIRKLGYGNYGYIFRCFNTIYKRDGRQTDTAWWLLLSANWRVWNTATSAAISIQCCCLTGVLSKEVRTRNAAPSRTSLAEGSRENPISFMCSCPPLPSWQCATVAPYLAETLHV